MTTESKTYREIFSATWDWCEIAERQGLGVEWEANALDWDVLERVAKDLGYLDEDDSTDDLGAGLLKRPRACDTALKPGDVVLSTGYGEDVLFIRADAVASATRL